VRPSRSLFDLESKSVKKKWKDKAFAAGANREEIAQAAQEFGIELWTHVDNVIMACGKLLQIWIWLGISKHIRWKCKWH